MPRGKVDRGLSAPRLLEKLSHEKSEITSIVQGTGTDSWTSLHNASAQEVCHSTPDLGLPATPAKTMLDQRKPYARRKRWLSASLTLAKT